MNFKLWNFNGDKKVEVEVQKPPETLTTYDDVTNHLKELEKKAMSRVDKISTTLDLIGSLTEDSEVTQIALAQERDIWKATFDAIPSFIILLDPEYKVTRVNKSFIEYIGINEKFIIGRDCKDILGNKFCNCMNYCPVRDDNAGCTEGFQSIKIDDGRHFTMSYSPVMNDDNYITGHVVLLYDITERVQAEMTMKIRDSVITSINKVTEKMLRDFKPTNGHRIDEMITEIGKAAQVSRVYIFNVISQDIVYYKHEWVDGTIEPQIDNPKMQSFDMSINFSRWVKILKSKNIIHGHTEDFPKVEHNLLNSQNVKSTLAVPIFIDKKYVGFIGFDECRQKRIWQDPEINALKMAANILSAWVERGRVEKSLRQTIEDNKQTNKKLGAYLIEEGYITKDQLDEALNKQKNER